MCNDPVEDGGGLHSAIDDDTYDFADRCSYDFVKVPGQNMSGMLVILICSALGSYTTHINK